MIVGLVILIILFIIINTWLALFFLLELKKFGFRLELKKVGFRIVKDKKPETNNKEPGGVQHETSPGFDFYKFDQEMKHYIDSIFDGFESDIKSFIVNLIKNEDIKTPPGDIISDRPEPPPYEIENWQGSDESNDLDGCIKIYNEAIQTSDKQGEFVRRFKPLRVDVVNAMRRRGHPDIAPEFQSAPQGDFLVVEIQDGGPTSFAVFPRFELVIMENNYRDGAVGEVFNCPGFYTQRKYGIKRLLAPAFFSRKPGERWELEKQGELELILMRTQNE